MFDAFIALLGAPIPLMFCIAGLAFGAIGTSGHVRHHDIDPVQQFFAGIAGFIFFIVGMAMLFPSITDSSFLVILRNMKNSSIIAVFSLVSIVFAYITRCASNLAKEKVHEIFSEKPKHLSEEDPYEPGRFYYHMFLCD